jgi:hypothetical protein
MLKEKKKKKKIPGNYKLDLLIEDFTNRIVEVASNSILKFITSSYSKS